MGLIPHGSKAQPFNHMVFLESSHWHMLGCVMKDPTMNNKDTPVTLEIVRISSLTPRKQRQRPAKFHITLLMGLLKYHSFPSTGPPLLSIF